MTRGELRRALRERRADLRRAMAKRRKETRARLDENPAVRRERTKRRLRRAAALALLLALLMLVRCDCEQPPGPPPVPEPPPKPAVLEKKPPETKKAAAPAPKKKPLRGQLETQPRAAYQGETRPPAAWVDEFRLQVSARSTRLARCFTGTERPGALRWTTAVNPWTGSVSDHELEPLGTTAGLGGDQRACVLKTLSEPPYRMGMDAGAVPERVGMVIEF